MLDTFYYDLIIQMLAYCYHQPSLAYAFIHAVALAALFPLLSVAIVSRVLITLVEDHIPPRLAAIVIDSAFLLLLSKIPGGTIISSMFLYISWVVSFSFIRYRQTTLVLLVSMRNSLILWLCRKLLIVAEESSRWLSPADSSTYNSRSDHPVSPGVVAEKSGHSVNLRTVESDDWILVTQKMARDTIFPRLKPRVPMGRVSNTRLER